MSPETARTIATAVGFLGAPDDAHALAAARCLAAIMKAEGVKPNAFASAMVVIITNMTRPMPARDFAEIGPRATRKRLVELSRRRGISAEDRTRVMALRDRLAEDPRAPISEDEIAWLDARWAGSLANAPARATESG